jgi:hypothetical protein
VVPILVQVQRQRDRANHLLLDPPWLIASQPRDSRISFEPIVQCPLACSECHWFRQPMILRLSLTGHSIDEECALSAGGSLCHGVACPLAQVSHNSKSISHITPNRKLRTTLTVVTFSQGIRCPDPREKRNAASVIGAQEAAFGRRFRLSAGNVAEMSTGG